MSSTFVKIGGDVVEAGELDLPKARALGKSVAFGALAYATLVECRKNRDSETVVIDVEVEIPQTRVYPINRHERIASTFYHGDNRIPEVLALRSDFPQVPHLNCRDFEIPRSLCLYEEPYRDIKRRWTESRFVERIREWLALTARGELHQPDQQLEPLLLDTFGRIVLPSDLISGSEINAIPKQLHVVAKDMKEDFFLIACREKPSWRSSLKAIASMHCCLPRTHGLVRRSPFNLSDLHGFTNEAGLDLIYELKARLAAWRPVYDSESDFLESFLVVIILLPKSRTEESEFETVEVRAFLIAKPIVEIGKLLGLWEETSSGPIEEARLAAPQKLGLITLNASFELSRAAALQLNGSPANPDTYFCAIGLGALGSQVVNNFARSGFGRWILVDEDRLLPHNLTRHALTDLHIGYNKASAASVSFDGFIADQELFSFLPCNVVDPGKHRDALAQELRAVDVIVDMSASVTVARYISFDVSSMARRLSLFMTPTGQDVVILAEDKRRNIRLDEIEMQYYRAIVELESLQGHFKPREQRLRYGQSCRDVSSVLPQEIVALHAAVGSGALRRLIASDEARILIWRADSRGNVRRVKVRLEASVRFRAGDWDVRTDQGLLQRLHRLRTTKLPNETGGVLLGSFDMERKVVYIVDTIPSPPDSEEWPMLYIRGCEGLTRAVEERTRQTDGMLEYVGEWHSHPPKAPTVPSDDDIEVFDWLKNWMARDGFPALMMIVGEPGHTSCFVGVMQQTEQLLPSVYDNWR